MTLPRRVPPEPSAAARDSVSDALALIHRALAMRNYGDKPVLWEQVWRDIEDAAQHLRTALAVGAVDAPRGVPVTVAQLAACPVCRGQRGSGFAPNHGKAAPSNIVALIHEYYGINAGFEELAAFLHAHLVPPETP